MTIIVWQIESQSRLLHAFVTWLCVVDTSNAELKAGSARRAAALDPHGLTETRARHTPRLASQQRHVQRFFVGGLSGTAAVDDGAAA